MFGFDKMFDFNGDGKLDNWDCDVFGDAGLDYDELEMMDPDERRGALEDAGLDPDEYDF